MPCRRRSASCPLRAPAAAELCLWVGVRGGIAAAQPAPPHCCPAVRRRGTAETSFWMGLERWIHERYGVEPRSWYEPLEDWQEQERPTSA